MIEKTTDYVHVDLIDGKAILTVYVDNWDEDKPESNRLTDEDCEQLSSGATELFITGFTITDVVDIAIDNNRYWIYEGDCMDPDLKPLFDAMKKEMAEAIKKIDAIQYVDPEKEKQDRLQYKHDETGGGK